MLVEITDVFLRDGLQDEHVIVSTAEKLAIAAGLQEAGVRRMEVASFVNPKKVPQMADAAELFAAKPDNAATWTGLALNRRGVERALAAGVDEIQVVTSASNAHSSANAGASTEAMLTNLTDAIRDAGVVASERFFAGISTAFTCPFEGVIPTERVVDLVGAFRDAGITEIGLADTLGTAEPALVLDTVRAVQSEVSGITLSLHLHNAHGRALETVTAAVDQGITRFDAALAGFGGCPFAPGAAGNLDTLELVHHLHALGLDTGIDAGALADLSDRARASVSAAQPITV